MNVTLLCPSGDYHLDERYLSQAREDAAEQGGSIDISYDIDSAYTGADFVYAKSWGALPYFGRWEDERPQREAARHFMVDERKMALTNDARFSHCLPLRRNVKATDGVMGCRLLRRHRRSGKPSSRPEGNHGAPDRPVEFPREDILQDKSVVLAFSGGLDTSFCVPWLAEKGYEVTTLFVDTGGVGDDELDYIATRAHQLGAVAHEVADVSEEVWREVVLPMLWGGQFYQAQYPLLCSDRYLIVKRTLQLCDRLGTSTIAHGCTGHGQ